MPADAEQEEDVALYRLLKRSNAVYSPHETAEYGTVEQVQKAVASSPQHVNITDEQGDTPLHKAARRGNAEVGKRVRMHWHRMPRGAHRVMWQKAPPCAS